MSRSAGREPKCRVSETKFIKHKFQGGARVVTVLKPLQPAGEERLPPEVDRSGEQSQSVTKLGKRMGEKTRCGENSIACNQSEGAYKQASINEDSPHQAWLADALGEPTGRESQAVEQDWREHTANTQQDSTQNNTILSNSRNI